MFRLALRLLVAAFLPLLPPGAQAQPRTDCPPAAQAPTAEQLQEGLRRARDHGMLWRLTRDGRTSWLYGTLHVGRMDWIFPGPNVQAALRASRRMALEIDISDPRLMQRLTQLPPGIAMPAVPRATRKRLDAQAAAACVDPAMLSALHPVLEATTYTLFAAQRQQLDPAWGQEAMLAGYARGARQPIISLETPESQLLALLPAEGAQAISMVDSMLEQLESGRAAAQIARLAAAWERGDLDELAAYESWCDCTRTEAERASVRALLDERNPGLADGIAAQHGQGAVFAAVGALHMVGPKSLPLLLRARGFTVERVAFAPGAAQVAAAQPAAASAAPASAP